jgi:hypothetical protein
MSTSITLTTESAVSIAGNFDGLNVVLNEPYFIVLQQAGSIKPRSKLLDRIGGV